MVTRFRDGTTRPTQRLNLYVSSVSSLPKSYRDAFNDPNWHNAMCAEYNILNKNRNWVLVPRPPNTNIFLCMWLFGHKYLADGTLSCYKTRLLANGSTHLKGVDVDETFSLAVKPGTIQTILSLAASRHWPIHQLDVKNFFYMRSLYDLKLAPRAWFQRFASYITRVGFDDSRYGTLSCYKARLVSNGSTHLKGVDVDETFSLAVKLGTIRTILSLAASRQWPIHQLD
nr:ribonuclease H-like domain-containing protein [Tanacetum cinerariifolium]